MPLKWSYNCPYSKNFPGGGSQRPPLGRFTHLPTHKRGPKWDCAPRAQKCLGTPLNISLYTKIMMVNISTIYTIFKLRLFPTIHCKWHQILVKFQKLLRGGGGGKKAYTAPPPSLPQLKGLTALASLLSNLEPPSSFYGCATAYNKHGMF